MQNPKINGFRFNLDIVNNIDSFEGFVKVYGKVAYAEFGREKQLEHLKSAWDLLSPATVPDKADKEKVKPKKKKK